MTRVAVGLLLLLSLSFPAFSAVFGVAYLVSPQLPLYRATVKIGDALAATDREGRFFIPSLPPGTYETSVTTPLGTSRSSVQVTGDMRLDLVFPLPSGWSTSDILSFVVALTPEGGSGAPRTVRWTKETISVWVDPSLPQGGRSVLKATVKKAIEELNRELEGLVTFSEAKPGGVVDIAIHQVPNREGTLGRCKAAPNQDYSFGFADIEIAVKAADRLGVVKHELLHALGLLHSPRRSDLMFSLYLGNERVSAEELVYLKALYSLSPGVRVGLAELFTSMPVGDGVVLALRGE